MADVVMEVPLWSQQSCFRCKRGVVKWCLFADVVCHVWMCVLWF